MYTADMKTCFYKMGPFYMQLNTMSSNKKLLQAALKSITFLSKLETILTDNAQPPVECCPDSQTDFGCVLHDMEPEAIRTLYCIASNSLESANLGDIPVPFDIPFIEEYSKDLHDVCLRSALFSGGALDYEASRVCNAVRYTSSGSVWFTRYVTHTE